MDQKTPGVKPRRRWRKFLLVAAVVFAGLVLLVIFLAPPVICSVAKSKIPSVLGEMLGADVAVEDVTFSWSGRIGAGGFKIVPKGFSEALVEVRKVDVETSLLSAATGKYLATVEVTGLRIVVEKDASGRFNYETLGKKEPEAAPAPAATPSPYVRAKVRVREGEVVFRAGGRETVFKNISAGADIDTLEKPIGYSFSLEDPAGGKVAAGGVFDMGKKAGSLLMENATLSLKNLAAAAGAYGPVADLDGMARLNLNYEGKGLPQVGGRGEVEVSDLKVESNGKTVKLARIVLSHEGALDEKGNGAHAVRLSLGPALESRLKADVKDALGTPALVVMAEADSDLAVLGETLRQVIELKQDVKLEGRAGFKGRVETRGKDSVRFDVDAKVADLVAVDKTRHEIDKSIEVKAAGEWDGARRALEVRGLKLDSSFASLEGKGGFSTGSPFNVEGSSFKLEADLEKLAAKLESFLEKPPALGGSVSLNAKYAGEKINVDGGLSGFRFDKLGPLNATLKHDGTLDKKGSGRHMLRVESGKALTADVTADVKEVFDVTPSVQVRFDVKSDLGALTEMVRGILPLKKDLRFEGNAVLAGETNVRVRKDTQGKGNSLLAAGLSAKADLSNLAAIEGRKRTEIDKTVKLAVEGSWDGVKSALDLKGFTLESSLATVKARGKCSLDSTLNVGESSLQLTAELDKLADKLALFMESPPELGGSVSLDAKYVGEKFNVDGGLSGFRFDKLGPLNATLKHDGTLDKKGSGRHVLRVESGKALTANVTADVKEAFDVTPSVQARFDAKSDIGALVEMLRGVLPVKKELRFEGKGECRGDVQASCRLDPKKQAPPVVSADFSLDASLADLAAVDAKTKKRTEIDKGVTLKAEGSWNGAKPSMDLKALALNSSFATVGAKGGFSPGTPLNVKESSLRLDANLEYLSKKLAVFMEAPPVLGGTVSLNAKYDGERYEMNGSTEGLKVDKIGPIKAALVQKGVYKAAEGGVLKIEEGKLTSNAVNANLSGEALSFMDEKKRQVNLKLDAVVLPVELSRWVRDLNLGGPEIRVHATVGMKPEEITASGGTQLDGLTWKDAADVIKTAKAQPVEFSLKLKGGDVAVKSKIAHFEWVDQGYSAKGALESDITHGPKGTKGTTKVANLEIVAGENVVKDPLVTVVEDVFIEAEAVRIKTARITSSFLRGDLSGSVRNWEKQPEFVAIRGSFKYIPDKLGAVLAPWLPGKLEGSGEKALDFKLDGKASTKELLSILRGTQGSFDLDLAKYTQTGLSVSGKTHFELMGGRMKSATPMEVNQGNAKVEALIDFREAEKKPQSTLDIQAKNVAANAEMGPLLEKINPIFYTQKIGGKVDGKVDSSLVLEWDGPIDPSTPEWIPAAKKSLKGGGNLAVRNLSIAGSPTVEAILSVLGEENKIQGEFLAGGIQIAGGRVNCGDATLNLAKYALKFSGWVDLDNKMKMMVEMPVTKSIAKKYGNIEKYIGKTFFVPLEGHTYKPRLDFEAAIQELAKRALEGVVKEKAKEVLQDKAKDVIEDKGKDLLDGLFKKKKKK